jgi:hypothetical protein
MPGFNPIFLLNKEGMTTQPLEDTVTIVELKAPIKTSKRYTPYEIKYNTLWESVKPKLKKPP